MLGFYLLVVPLVSSLRCYDYFDRQIGGTIFHGDKQIVECSNPAFCLSIYREGNDENIYSLSCANNTAFETTCENVGCANSHGDELSTKKCCCNIDLCNTISTSFYSLSSVALLLGYRCWQ